MGIFTFTGSGGGGAACVCVPDPYVYWDGTSTSAQIGTNSFSLADLDTTEGKFDSNCLEFGSSGTHRPALLQTPIDLAAPGYSWTFYFKSKRSGSDWGSLLKKAGTGSSNAPYPIITENSTADLGVYTGGTFTSSGYDMTVWESSTDWVHLAVSASTTTGKSRFFINGAFVGEANAIITGQSVGDIGGYDGTDEQVFSEFLDEIAYWNIPLSDAQIEKIYNENRKISAFVPLNW